MAKDPVVVAPVATEADVGEGFALTQARSRALFWTVAICSIPISIWAAWEVSTGHRDGFYWSAASTFGIVALLALWFLYSMYVTQPKRYVDAYRRTQPRYSFAESGLEYASSEHSGSIDWKAFSGWRETERIFLLYSKTHDGRTTIVPKAGVPDGRLDELRRLIASYVPEQRLRRWS